MQVYYFTRTFTCNNASNKNTHMHNIQIAYMYIILTYLVLFSYSQSYNVIHTCTHKYICNYIYVYILYTYINLLCMNILLSYLDHRYFLSKYNYYQMRCKRQFYFSYQEQKVSFHYENNLSRTDSHLHIIDISNRFGYYVDFHAGLQTVHKQD